MLETFSALKITSLKNPKVKEALTLYKKSVRDETGLFLIEGYRELLRLTQSCLNIQIKAFFYCKELFLGKNENALIEEIKKRTDQVYECEKRVFERLSYRDRPDGLIAIADQNYIGLNDLKKFLFSKSFLKGSETDNHDHINEKDKKDEKERNKGIQKERPKKAPFLVVAESIEKPGNLGTILRSADGAGADALILCDERTDLFNPNVVRASVGTLFTLPVVKMATQDALALFKQAKIQIVATSPESKRSYTEVDLKRPVAIIVGSEQLGLSDAWLKKADIKVKIPMLGVSDSLNVAAAATLMLYEVLRQRYEA